MELVDLEVGDARWEHALPVLRALRPHLDRASLDAVHRSGADQGLVFTAALAEDGRCLGVAGWRVMHTTTVQRKVYVDDLVVDEAARSTGVGAALLGHLEDRARRAGCHAVELDSGHHRVRAHAFYERAGYQDVSRHFAKPLDS